MKILLLGANGQVGWELRRSLASLGQLMACDRNTIDLGNSGELQTIIRDYSPNIIVNAAAYTAVDKAESEPEIAQRINADAVKVLASEAKILNAWLIHYSTDYVYDGTKSSPYIETDPTNPQSVYGQTKLQGEEVIRESGCNHLIFRTCWVYAARGSNFAKTMLRLSKERDELRVVADQVGAPTSAELVADITALCIHRITGDKDFGKQVAGTYHLSPAGETSWYEYARFVIAEAQNSDTRLRTSLDNIFPITSNEYPVPAKRPANSRLDTKKLVDTFNVYLPYWQTMVKRLVTELIVQDEL